MIMASHILPQPMLNKKNEKSAYLFFILFFEPNKKSHNDTEY